MAGSSALVAATRSVGAEPLCRYGLRARFRGSGFVGGRPYVRGMREVLVDEREAAGLDALAGLAGQEAALYAAMAGQLHDSAVLSRRLCGAGGPERFLEVEVAGTLRIGQGAAGHRLREASRLVETLTCTFAGLAAGAVFLGQARIVLELTESCTEAVAAEVDRRLHTATPDLACWSGRRLRDRVRRLVLTVEADLDPLATARRELTARARRKVSVRPEPDGMGSLWALLPAEQLRAFTVGLDELHRRQQTADRALGIDRTADQRRADLIAMLPALALHALDGTAPTVSPAGACTHPAVLLHVHIPMATALGRSSEPATLDGYGPISASHARLLLPDATLRAVLVDSATGQPLHLDPALHRPAPHRPAPHRPAGHERHPDETQPTARPAPADIPAAQGPATEAAPVPVARLAALMPDGPVLVRDDPEPRHHPSTGLARLVRLRDPLCTGPGCSQSAHRCDLDHATPWPAGPTAAGNLTPKSRRCHRAKTLSWQVIDDPDGSHTWTGPSGRSYPVPAYWPPPPPPRPHRQDPQLPPPHPELLRALDGPALPDLAPDLNQPTQPTEPARPPERLQLIPDRDAEPPF